MRKRAYVFSSSLDGCPCCRDSFESALGEGLDIEGLTGETETHCIVRLHQRGCDDCEKSTASVEFKEVLRSPICKSASGPIGCSPQPRHWEAGVGAVGLLTEIPARPVVILIWSNKDPTTLPYYCSPRPKSPSENINFSEAPNIRILSVKPQPPKLMNAVPETTPAVCMMIVRTLKFNISASLHLDIPWFLMPFTLPITLISGFGTMLVSIILVRQGTQSVQGVPLLALFIVSSILSWSRGTFWVLYQIMPKVKVFTGQVYKFTLAWCHKWQRRLFMFRYA